MVKKIFIPLIIIFFVGLGIISVRFLFGGNEDDWICTKGQWIKHGNPSASKPKVACMDNWEKQSFNEAGLSLELKIPSDATFRKEIADDAGRIRVASFYVEKGSSENPRYQLYAVYQPLENVTELELERAKTGMDPNTVKEILIDNFKGIEGLTVISGPKTHYSTVILKGNKLFSVSTWPPTPENKALTDQILSTFDFK